MRVSITLQGNFFQSLPVKQVKLKLTIFKKDCAMRQVCLGPGVSQCAVS